MTSQPNYLHVEVEVEEYSELADELNKDAGHNNVDWDEFQQRLKEDEE